MYIDELPIGSPIELEVNIEGKKLNLASIICHPADMYDKEDHGVLVEPFKFDGRLLKFDRGQLTVNADNIDDGKYYKYMVKEVTAVRHNNVVYHLIASNDDAKFVNRRDAVRVSLSTRASIQYDGHNVTATTKDISATGIAFILDDLNAPAVGTRLRCKFDKFYLTYNVTCKVVRCVKDKKGNRTLVGCEFERNYQNVNELINEIQMYNRPNRRRV